MFFGLLALILGVAFTAIALYISAAEQPARLKLIAPSALAHWKTAYFRGFIIQGALAALAGLAAIIAFFDGWHWRFLIGGLIILANWPYTYYLMMPVNRQLQAVETGAAGDGDLAIMGRWGLLHLARGGMGLLACVFFVWGIWAMLTAASLATAL